MSDRIRSLLAMGLFVILAGYVGWSAFRLAFLLWQRLGTT
ncbi:MAG: hypothetical protein RLZZ609_2592 [Cyanobacteriota bacterium]|jgi:hypothetical protein